MFPGFSTINPRALDDDDDEKHTMIPVDKDQQKPFACLRRRDGETYCGRDYLSSEEFVFQDAAYALQHYLDSKLVAVCKKCAARATTVQTPTGCEVVAVTVLEEPTQVLGPDMLTLLRAMTDPHRHMTVPMMAAVVLP